MTRVLRHLVRSALESKGYWVRHNSVLPFGIAYERDVDRLSRKFSVPIDVVFDVGANIGQSSELALENFQEATVFAFEPDKKTFAVLTQRLVSPRFRAFNLALSNRSGEARFFDYGELATSNSLVEDSQFASRTHNPATVRSVPCETLDGLCERLEVNRIDLLKVDAEGHDLAVIQGATRMLAEHRIRFVFVEFNTLLPRAGVSGGALLPISELLERVGFSFVASYPEYMITTGEFFATSNALFFHQ